MRKLFIILILSYFSIYSLVQTSVIAIKNIALIDVINGKVNRDQTVIIEANRIISVSSKPVIPATATVIEAGGKYLIPGLWDMHAHSFTVAG